MKSLCRLTSTLIALFIWSSAAAQHASADSDGDGIPDVEDACPHKPGPKTNQGCPVEAVKYAATSKKPVRSEKIIDSLKKRLFASLDAAPDSKQSYHNAAWTFAIDVKFVAGLQSTSEMREVLSSVLREKASGNPLMGGEMAQAFHGATGVPFSLLVDVLPEPDRKAILQAREQQGAVAKTAVKSDTIKRTVVTKPPVKNFPPPLFKKGDFLALTNPGWLVDNGGIDAYVSNYKDGVYTLLVRSKRKDLKIPSFSLSTKTIKQSNAEKEYMICAAQTSGKTISFCRPCGSSGVIYAKHERTYGGKWEQINFNTSVKTTERTVSWEERSECGHCSGLGWPARYK